MNWGEAQARGCKSVDMINEGMIRYMLWDK